MGRGWESGRQDTGFNRFEISSPSIFEKIGRIEVFNARDELIAGEDFDVALAEHIAAARGRIQH